MVLKNGRIVDGTLSEPYIADILISGDVIEDIGPGIEAGDQLDLEGLWVTPGFIDVHSHEDFPGADGEHKLRQGITTEVTGNCGLGYFPLAKGMGEYHRRAGLAPSDLEIRDYAEYRRILGATHTNRAMLVGHGNLRHAAADLRHMSELLELCLTQGAVGLSAGLCYLPGSLAGTEELETLCRVTAEHDAIFAVHLRSEAAIEESLDECIALAEKTGVRLHVSHIKAMGTRNWGKAADIIKRIEGSGLGITADCYPYTGSMTGCSVMEPNFNRGIESRGGAERIFIDGKSLAELARETGTTATAAAESLAAEGRVAVFECMCRKDLDAFIKTPWVMIGTDGILNDWPHPRTFGAFPRFLQRYVVERDILNIQTAIHKITALPAKIFGIPRRGLLKKGFFADLVILDLPRVRSDATFKNPRVLPGGIRAVMINGNMLY